MGRWTTEQLTLLATSQELEVAPYRADGTPRPFTPVWVVRAGDEVLVRTWHRRDTGWYGAALRSGRARARVPGLEADVLVEDVGEHRRLEVDAAYLEKYAAGSRRMVGDEAAGTTLRLTPADGAQPSAS